MGKHRRGYWGTCRLNFYTVSVKFATNREVGPPFTDLIEARCLVKIRFGYELVYSVPQLTPMIFTLHCQPHGNQQLVKPDVMRTEPAIPLFFYPDAFGNTSTRLEAPPWAFTCDGRWDHGGLRCARTRAMGGRRKCGPRSSAGYPAVPTGESLLRDGSADE